MSVKRSVFDWVADCAIALGDRFCSWRDVEDSFVGVQFTDIHIEMMVEQISQFFGNKEVKEKVVEGEFFLIPGPPNNFKLDDIYPEVREKLNLDEYEGGVLRAHSWLIIGSRPIEQNLNWLEYFPGGVCRPASWTEFLYARKILLSAGMEDYSLAHHQGQLHCLGGNNEWCFGSGNSFNRGIIPVIVY